MGDLTWEEYVPNDFTELHGFSSYNDFDYDSVDENVEETIIPMLERKEFNLAIAHCAGVDHIGHTTHSNTVVMGEKLDKMNS